MLQDLHLIIPSCATTCPFQIVMMVIVNSFLGSLPYKFSTVEVFDRRDASKMIMSHLAFFTNLVATAAALTIPAAPSIFQSSSGNLTTPATRNETSALLLNTYPPVSFGEWISIEIDAYIWINNVWPAYGDAAHTESVLNSLVSIQETKFPCGGRAPIDRAHETNGLVAFDFYTVHDGLTTTDICGVLLAVRRVMERYGIASIAARYIRLGLDKAIFLVYLSGG